MGKKKKKFHKYHPTPNQSNVVAVQTTSPSPAPTPALVDRNASVYQAHQAEYRLISGDLIRVAIINAVFLAAVLALYFVNKSNPFLDQLFEKLF